MENWQLAIIILVSVLLGALIPVFAMAALLLASLKRQVESTGRRVDDTLDGVQVAVDRVNRVSSGIDGLEEPIADMVTMLGDLTEAIDSARSSLKIATAAGAAVAPAVATFIKSMSDDGDGPDPDEIETPEHDQASVDEEGQSDDC